MKPRLRFNRMQREWVCSDDVMFAYAWGDSPEVAFREWERKINRLARLRSEGLR